MPTFVVDHRALAKSIERGHKEAVERVVGAIRTTVKLHGPRIAQRLVDSENPKPVNRGTYRRSFVAEDVWMGVEFYNFALHAPIIEDGRRRGAKMPPLVTITAWVFQKKIVRGGRSFVSESKYQEARRIAFLIARAIAKRGLPAHKILARTSRELTPIVQARVDEALG